MADNEEREETSRKGNEWEVVSLTASAYAAAPGPKEVVNSIHGSDVEDEGEISGMLMSRHFVFPPSQHENLPLDLEPEHVKPLNEKVGEYDASSLATEEGDKTFVKDDDNLSIEELMSREFPRIQVLDEKGNRILSRSCFEEGGGTHKPEEPESDSGSQKHNNLPCEAWWKRRALSVYVHAKEANRFWSLFIAAAVMGLVIIGHQWQQERWKLLHLKWQFGVNDERMGRILSPISRFKDVIIGGHKRGSQLVHGSIVNEL